MSSQMVRNISLLAWIFGGAFCYSRLVELLPTFLGVVEGFGRELYDDLLVVA